MDTIETSTTETSTIDIRFDSANVNWNSRYEYNQTFISMTQNYLNNLVRLRGHVFLNEMYDMMGVKRTTQGATDGWTSDNYIRITFMYSPETDEAEKAIILRVHGIVRDIHLTLDKE